MSQPRVTIIVPTYQGADRILTCLDDFAAQTLPPDQFEVVVVQNGPPTETPRLVEEWRQRHPAYQVRLIETDVASAQNARNIVLDGAAGPIAEWVGFVDDDDRLQPRYLESLMNAAEPGTIPYTRVGITIEGRPGQVDYTSWLTAIPEPFVGKPHTNADVWPAMQAAWAKVVERSVIGDVRFDRSLKYADDTVFWMEVLARSNAKVTLTDFGRDTSYLWVQREGTITRATTIDEWTTYVIHKLDAVAALHATLQPTTSDDTRLVCEGLSAFFLSSVRTYLVDHPHDAERADAAIRERQIPGFPWQLVHDGLGGQLVFVDPHDKAAISRLAEDGALSTVVATRPLGSGERAIRQRLDEVLTGLVTLPVTEVTWQLVGAVTTELRGFLDDAGHTRALLRSLRTDSEAPLEHLLGAMMKLAYQWPWTAYLGAPSVARRGLTAGAGGKAAVQADDTFSVLGSGLGAARLGIEEVPETMGALAELAVVALADTVELVDDLQLRALRERLTAGGAPEGVLARLDRVVRLGHAPSV